MCVPAQGGRTPITTLYGMKQEATPPMPTGGASSTRHPCQAVTLPDAPIVAPGAVSVETPPRGNHLVV